MPHHVVELYVWTGGEEWEKENQMRDGALTTSPILTPDADCLCLLALISIYSFNHIRVYRQNNPCLSPSGQFPYLKHGSGVILAGVDKIIEYLLELYKGDIVPADGGYLDRIHAQCIADSLRAYMSLQLWHDSVGFTSTKRFYSRILPFPLSWTQPRRMREQIVNANLSVLDGIYPTPMSKESRNVATGITLGSNSIFKFGINDFDLTQAMSSSNKNHTAAALSDSNGDNISTSSMSAFDRVKTNAFETLKLYNALMCTDNRKYCMGGDRAGIVDAVLFGYLEFIRICPILKDSELKKQVCDMKMLNALHARIRSEFMNSTSIDDQYEIVYTHVQFDDFEGVSIFSTVDGELPTGDNETSNNSSFVHVNERSSMFLNEDSDYYPESDEEDENNYKFHSNPSQQSWYADGTTRTDDDDDEDGYENSSSGAGMFGRVNWHLVTGIVFGTLAMATYAIGIGIVAISFGDNDGEEGYEDEVEFEDDDDYEDGYDEKT